MKQPWTVWLALGAAWSQLVLPQANFDDEKVWQCDTRTLIPDLPLVDDEGRPRWLSVPLGSSIPAFRARPLLFLIACQSHDDTEWAEVEEFASRTTEHVEVLRVVVSPPRRPSASCAGESESCRFPARGGFIVSDLRAWDLDRRNFGPRQRTPVARAAPRHPRKLSSAACARRARHVPRYDDPTGEITAATGLSQEREYVVIDRRALRVVAAGHLDHNALDVTLDRVRRRHHRTAERVSSPETPWSGSRPDQVLELDRFETVQVDEVLGQFPVTDRLLSRIELWMTPPVPAVFEISYSEHRTGTVGPPVALLVVDPAPSRGVESAVSVLETVPTSSAIAIPKGARWIVRGRLLERTRPATIRVGMHYTAERCTELATRLTHARPHRSSDEPAAARTTLTAAVDVRENTEIHSLTAVAANVSRAFVQVVSADGSERGQFDLRGSGSPSPLHTLHLRTPMRLRAGDCLQLHAVSDRELASTEPEHHQPVPFARMLTRSSPGSD